MAIKRENEYPIDFVITWVDGSDPNWQKEYLKYKDDIGDQRIGRFRDMETLKYLFRGFEKFAPWVNKVYFVTSGQKPEWLNTGNPKLVCVDHKDFIPEQYLPTFSSHAIELNLHRIKGLSEHFVYFNDDMFIVRPTSREVFFKQGLPCDSAILAYSSTIEQQPFLVPQAVTAVINRNFQKYKVVRKQMKKFFNFRYNIHILRTLLLLPEKWFPGFRHSHLPTSLLKSTFEEVWKREYDILDSTSKHKFRVLSDVNQWLMQAWQICTGNFIPRSPNIGLIKALGTKKEIKEAAKIIVNGRHKLICVNDGYMEDFDFVKKEVSEAFEQILPEKSTFEL